MDKEDTKTGFAGLDSLVSDITKDVGRQEDAPTDVERASKSFTDHQSSSTSTSSKHNVSNPGYPGATPNTAYPTRDSQEMSTSLLPSRTATLGVRWAVILAILGVITIIYWVYVSSRSSVDDYRPLIKNQNYQSSGNSDTRVTDDGRGKTVSVVKKQPITLSGRSDPLDKKGVCVLQEILGELGHYNSTVDGISGPGTRNAISVLLDDYPAIDGFQPTIQVLEYAQSKVLRKEAGIAATTARVTLPRSGQVLSRRSQGVAPFKISTSPGVNYYVKLADANGRGAAITFFVRGGHTAELDVPLGTYSLRYASGKTWYGTTCLFGRNTTYFEADTTLKFYKSGARVVGHRVELIKQIRGNMDTNHISAGQF